MKLDAYITGLAMVARVIAVRSAEFLYNTTDLHNYNTASTGKPVAVIAD